MGFILPLSWNGDYRVDGFEADGGDVFSISSPDGYGTLGKNRDNILVSLKRREVLAAMGALAGGNLPDDPTMNVHLSGVGYRAKSLKRGIGGILQRAMDGSEAKRGEAFMTAALETELISFVASWLLEGTDELTERRFDHLESRAIVRRLEAQVFERRAMPMSLAELCALAGVGATRLHAAFIDIYGVSPARYLGLMRLSNAREALLNRDAPPVSVKAVAWENGFPYSGRFAGQYADLFGEKPGDTLIRTRHLAQ